MGAIIFSFVIYLVFLIPITLLEIFVQVSFRLLNLKISFVMASIVIRSAIFILSYLIIIGCYYMFPKLYFIILDNISINDPDGIGGIITINPYLLSIVGILTLSYYIIMYIGYKKDIKCNRFLIMTIAFQSLYFSFISIFQALIIIGS